MGILEKIADIEKEIAKTQKNKATEYHLGLLKAKLAKYRVSVLVIRGTSKFNFYFSRNFLNRRKKEKKVMASMC